MNRLVRAFGFLVASVGAVCGSAAALDPDEAGPVEPIYGETQVHPQAEGFWLSEPFGYALHVGAQGLKRYEWDGQVCFAVPEAAKGATATLSLEYRFVRFGPGGDWAIFKYLGDGDGGFVFTRTADLPEACEREASWDRAAILDYAVRLIGRHYAFFEARGIDWQARAENARAALASVRDDDAFFELLGGLIDGFSDSHTKLLARINGEPRRRQDGLGETLPRIRQTIGEGAWLVGILKTLLTETLDAGAQHTANERIVWGTLEGGRIGYIQIFTMGGFSGDDIASEGFFEREIEALDTVMREAFSAFEGTEALILDLSNNRGGIGEIANRLPGYFAAQETVAFTTQVPTTGFAPEPTIIRPLTIRYQKPVYVLTSDVTVSGGEIAVLGLRALPQVTHAGATTRGSFSTVFSKPLPNGWIFELSNEIYAGPDGTVYEEIGLTPAWPLDVFPEDAPIKGHSAALKALVQRIGRAPN